MAERDMLAVRVNALEEKLNENRAERAQIDQYKQARPCHRRRLALCGRHAWGRRRVQGPRSPGGG